MSRFVTTTLEAENEKLDFIKKAKEDADKHPWHSTYGDLDPGSYFAIRWGMDNDCLAIFKLDPDHQPELVQNCLDRDQSIKLTDTLRLVKQWDDQGSFKKGFFQKVIEDFEKNHRISGQSHDESCCCIQCVVSKMKGHLKNAAPII